MIIPANMLSEDALHGMIEEFVTREGTDYGIEEVSLAERVEQVKAQILSGEALIHFDSAENRTQILAKSELARLRAKNQQKADQSGEL